MPGARISINSSHIAQLSPDPVPERWVRASSEQVNPLEVSLPSRDGSSCCQTCRLQQQKAASPVPANSLLKSPGSPVRGPASPQAAEQAGEEKPGTGKGPSQSQPPCSKIAIVTEHQTAAQRTAEQTVHLCHSRGLHTQLRQLSRAGMRRNNSSLAPRPESAVLPDDDDIQQHVSQEQDLLRQPR